MMPSRSRSSPLLSLRSANGVGLFITRDVHDVTYVNFDVGYHFNLTRRVSFCAHTGPSLYTQEPENPYRFTCYKKQKWRKLKRVNALVHIQLLKIQYDRPVHADFTFQSITSG